MGSESEDVHVEDSDESLLDFKEVEPVFRPLPDFIIAQLTTS